MKNLNDFEKKILRFLKNNVNRWCEALIKKFKQFVSSALLNFISEWYILDDVRNKKDISNFVFQIMRHVKIINIEDLHEQFTWAYNVIVLKIIRNIDSFEKIITVAVFLFKLKNKKKSDIESTFVSSMKKSIIHINLEIFNSFLWQTWKLTSVISRNIKNRLIKIKN